MLKKSEIINLLNSIADDTNQSKIEKFKEKIANIDEKSWESLLIDRGIETLQDAKTFLINAMKVRSSEFIELNELVSYGITEMADTITLHLVPKDARNFLNHRGLQKAEYLLIDALEKIQVMLQEDEKLESIKNIYAVSGIIKKPISTLFTNLGFDVKTMKTKLAKDDPELQRFYEMFKDKNSIGRANLSKEKLLSKEWNYSKDERKTILIQNQKGTIVEQGKEKEEKSEFAKDLGQVYSQEEILEKKSNLESSKEDIEKGKII